MFNKIKIFAIILLVLNAGNVQGQSFSVSWYFRGQAVQNNSVLQFNMYDTLSLTCKAYSDLVYYIPLIFGYDLLVRPMFAITRGPSQPSDMYFDYTPDTIYSLEISNPITLIYSDWKGIQPGFENFVILPGYQSYYTTDYFRYVNVGVLRPEDSGTYHCTATMFPDQNINPIDEDDGEEDEGEGERKREIIAGASIVIPEGFLITLTSGGVTIMVNTKPDQARSTRSKTANMLTYSVAMLGASKILF